MVWTLFKNVWPVYKCRCHNLSVPFCKPYNNKALQLTGVEFKTTAVNCVARSSYWETSSRLTGQVIPHVLRSLKLYYLVHKSPTGTCTESDVCSSHPPVIFRKYQQHVSEVVCLLQAFTPKFCIYLSFLFSRETLPSPKSFLRFVDRAPLCNFVNRTNLVHKFS